MRLRESRWIATTATSKQTGAFALAVGSRDADLIIRLPPGESTVLVAGKDTFTGTALVELHDLDP